MSHTNVVCPFCFWNRPLKASEGGLPLGDFERDPADTPVIQLREVSPGPGRGHKGSGVGGFPVVAELSLAEALEDPAYSELAEEIRSRLIFIIRDYLKNGIININEII